MQGCSASRHRNRRRNDPFLVNVVTYQYWRSLGVKCEINDACKPSVPVYGITDLENRDYRLGEHTCPDGNDIRQHAILGFVPDDSRMILTMTASTPAISMEEMEASTGLVEAGSKLAIWHFQPSSKPALSILRTTPVHMNVDTKNLWRAYTAFTGRARTIAQVLVYWNLIDGAGGQVLVRYLNLDFSVDQRAVCMTDEVSSTTTCFAKREYYIPVLLQTRCLFLMRNSTASGTPRSMPAYWTGESEWSFVSPSENIGVRAFEFDLFVESLLGKTTAGSEVDPGAKAKYYRPFFCTRNTTELVRAYEVKRRVKLLLEHGIVFTLAVLTADLGSLLILTLFIDPMWVHQAESTRETLDESVRVLEAKRWKLAQPDDGHAGGASTTDIGKRLDRAVQKIHPAQQTGPHNCKAAGACGGGGRDVLATYDPHHSVDLIEGDYWHISGEGWNNDI